MLCIASQFPLGELIERRLMKDHRTRHWAFSVWRRSLNFAKFFEIEVGNLNHQLHEFPPRFIGEPLRILLYLIAYIVLRHTQAEPHQEGTQPRFGFGLELLKVSPFVTTHR